MDDILERRFIRLARRRFATDSRVRKNDVHLAEIPGKIRKEPSSVVRQCNIDAIAVRVGSQFSD